MNENIIYDECHVSVGDKLDVERGVEITPEQMMRKREKLLSLAEGSGVIKNSSIFSKIEVDSKTKSATKTSFILYTKDSAAMRVTLFSYNSSRCFLGTQGSPVKILTGQNLEDVTCEENSILKKIAQKIPGCSDFEAKSVLSFILLGNMVSKEMPKAPPFYSEEETSAIFNLNIGVYSITFATYRWFGETSAERDKNIHFMAYLATRTVTLDENDFPLVAYFKSKAEAWRNMPVEAIDEEYVGKNTGLLLYRLRGTGYLYKQMYYLKDYEINAKSHSGASNREVWGEMSEEEQGVAKRKVRVDNTFYKEYIREWLRQLTGVEPSVKLTVKEVSKLFNNPEYIKAMARAITDELGIRTILLGATPNEIRGLLESPDSPLSTIEKSVLEKWVHLTVSTSVSAKGNSSKLSWQNLTLDDSVAYKLNHKLRALHNLDISLPFAFYLSLHNYRVQFGRDGVDLQVSEAAGTAYEGPGSFKELLPDVKKKLAKTAQDRTLKLRGVITMLPSKKKALMLKDAQNG